MLRERLCSPLQRRFGVDNDRVHHDTSAATKISGPLPAAQRATNRDGDDLSIATNRLKLLAAAAAVGISAALLALVSTQGASAVPPALTSADCPSGTVSRARPTYVHGAITTKRPSPEEVALRWAFGSGFADRHPNAQRNLAYDDGARRDYVFERNGQREAILTIEHTDDRGWHITSTSECGG